MSKSKYYIIGGGISGLTLAHKLSSSNHSVHIFESSAHLGGRLRSYYDENLQSTIDNGNHLLLSLNKNSLSLIEELNLIDNFHKFSLKDHGIKFYYDNLNSFSIIQNKKDFFNSKISSNTLSILFNILFKNNISNSVSSLYKKHDTFFTHYLDLLSRSILNTTSEIASSLPLNKVLRKILFSKDLQYLYPKDNWGSALISPLENILLEKNVTIHKSSSLKQVSFDRNKIVKLHFSSLEIDCSDSVVILATPPSISQQILSPHLPLTFPDEFSPILNIHFKLPHNLNPQIIAINDREYLDWIFVKNNIISTTCSAFDLSLGLPPALAQSTWVDICKIFPELSASYPQSSIPPHRVLIEKRATMLSSPSQLKKRPSCKTSLNNLYLTGDYINSPLPATIESAISSSINLSRLIS